MPEEIPDGNENDAAEGGRGESGVANSTPIVGDKSPEPEPPADAPPVIPLPASDRTAGTIGVALSLARQGVQVIRVHDVAAVRQAMLLFQATGGLC